jgi:hypothetical protein
MKEIVAFAILICLALVSIQPVLAGTVSTYTIYGPFIATGPSSPPAAPSQFDADFFHITEASVTLSSGTYTFEMTMKSTPSEWMTKDWQPEYAKGHPRISAVGYHWQISDDSGSYLGILIFAWHLGTIELEVAICPPSANNGCFASVGIGAGLGYQVYCPNDLPDKSLTGWVDQPHNSVRVTISQSDLYSLFPKSPPTIWRALSGAAYISVASGGASYVVYFTTVEDFPTT